MPYLPASSSADLAEKGVVRMADGRNFEHAAGKVPYPLKNDLLFHCVVQEKPDILKGLLSAVLQIEVSQIHDVQVLNPISYGGNVTDKQIVLDLLLVLSNAGHINVEIQVRSQVHWTDRSLYYLARRYAEQKADRYYTNLLPVIQIAFTDFTPFPKYPEFHAVYQMQNRKHHYMYSDKFLIHQIDLTRTDLAEPDDEKNGLVGWAQLFRAETWEQIQKLSKQNTFIRKAAIEMYELTAEDKIRIMLEEKRRIEMDYYSFIRRAKEEGIEKGTEKTLALINLLRPEELKELTGSSGDKQKEILARLLKKYQIE